MSLLISVEELRAAVEELYMALKLMKGEGMGGLEESSTIDTGIHFRNICSCRMKA